jgi:TRAP-type C4-dicarboxylate transport system permease small subunit
MRKFLDFLYRASGVAAAAFLLAICVVVLLQVGANIIDSLVGWITGTPIGLVVPSYAEFAGFFLASSSFLALAYALRSGSHIRVSLIIQRIGGLPRRLIELFCCAVGASFSAYFAYFTVKLVIESWQFGDVSPGMVPVALWIPQTAMAVGLIVLTIALVDCFFEALRGEEPAYAKSATPDDDAVAESLGE